MQKLRSPPELHFMSGSVWYSCQRIRNLDVSYSGEDPGRIHCPDPGTRMLSAEAKDRRGCKEHKERRCKAPKRPLQTNSLQNLSSFPIESGGTKRES